MGPRLSHYELGDPLGKGGMGVVYKATDTRLGRTVAVKLLRPEVIGDPAMRARFQHEARAASALNHPNIVTVHDIDRADDQDFLVTEFIDGEPLEKTIAGKAMPVAQALSYAMQIASALGAAHDAGIVHRDLKPGNIMITGPGSAHPAQVKILDFGLAKQISSPHVAPDEETRSLEQTKAGTILGTAPYMSPEQAEGKPVDARSDIFSFGAILYEMLTGRRAFAGSSLSLVLAAIHRDTPPPPRDVPEELRRIVYRCLEKDAARRYAGGRELYQELATLESRLAAKSTGLAASLRRPRNAAIAALCVALPLAALVWLWMHQSRIQRVRTKLLPEASRLADKGEYYACFRLLQEAQQIVPDDPELKRLRTNWIFQLPIETEPAGADVFISDYIHPDAAWDHLGTSPIKNAAVPFGIIRYKIVKSGFDPVEGAYGTVPPVLLRLKLTAAGQGHSGMVFVPAGQTNAVAVPEFWLDRYEVTNRQFKEFVERGGYREQRFWKHPFVSNGRSLSFEDGMKLFRDATGRPGPATWKVGSYADGEADYPVGGVSWYEAAAFAEFAGKTLPTFYHWRYAAGYGYFSDILRLSNFGMQGLAPVGKYRGLGPSGTYDMAGNVKEWCHNEVGAKRYILGGAWNEPSYVFTNTEAADPLEREPSYGFRCAIYPAPVAESLTAAITRMGRDFSKEKPVSDEVFRTFLTLFTYEKSDLDSKGEATIDNSPVWRQEVVSFRAAYANERVPARLFLPKNASPPYQTVVYFPSAEALSIRSSERFMSWWPEFVVRSGRALVLPVYKGTYERMTSFPGQTGERDRTIFWSKDLSRAIDYLQSRSDIDNRKLAYFGISMGSRWAPVFLAVEPRFRTAILEWGGFSSFRSLDPVESLNYAPRVKIPVLMLNGRQDFIFPYESSQLPLFRMLGTPAADKKHVVYESGHIPPKMDEAIKESLEWLDRYLGPVATR